MFAKVKNKKGFTLVELIVVLVILAILAALLVPALTGYIDKAKEKKIVAETRMVVMAVQTVTSEAYGQLDTGKDLRSTITEDWTFHAASGSTTAGDGKYIQEIKKLAEVFDSNPKATFYAAATAQGKILTLSYNNGVYTCTYSADEQSYTTTKNASTIQPIGSCVEFMTP